MPKWVLRAETSCMRAQNVNFPVFTSAICLSGSFLLVCAYVDFEFAIWACSSACADALCMAPKFRMLSDKWSRSWNLGKFMSLLLNSLKWRSISCFVRNILLSNLCKVLLVCSFSRANCLTNRYEAIVSYHEMCLRAQKLSYEVQNVSY